MLAPTIMEKSAPKAILICKIHQNGPWLPIKSGLHRNSLVWNTTLSMSSSKRSTPMVWDRSEIVLLNPCTPPANPPWAAKNNVLINIISFRYLLALIFIFTYLFYCPFLSISPGFALSGGFSPPVPLGVFLV